MSREWKPGDVALARWRHFDGTIALFVGAKQRWVDVDGAEFDGDEDDLTLRPLVVIDAEDREQVERLLTILHGGTSGADVWLCNNADRLADALREFADPKPPKPEEPTGLGAVVEDADGRRWVRSDDTDCVNPWHRNGSYEAHEYADIDAVRVLSEGVQP